MTEKCWDGQKDPAQTHSEEEEPKWDTLTFDSGQPRVPEANCCWPLRRDTTFECWRHQLFGNHNRTPSYLIWKIRLTKFSTTFELRLNSDAPCIFGANELVLFFKVKSETFEKAPRDFWFQDLDFTEDTVGVFRGFLCPTFKCLVIISIYNGKNIRTSLLELVL